MSHSPECGEQTDGRTVGHIYYGITQLYLQAAFRAAERPRKPHPSSKPRLITRPADRPFFSDFYPAYRCQTITATSVIISGRRVGVYNAAIKSQAALYTIAPCGKKNNPIRQDTI